MPEPVKSYEIRSRFFVKEQGWKVETIVVTGTFQQAGREASRVATVLDGVYGDSHFWTVDLYGLSEGSQDLHDGLGSYYQLFHGRLS